MVCVNSVDNLLDKNMPTTYEQPHNSLKYLDIHRTSDVTKLVTNTRPYQRTHPWLTFQFDLRRLRHTDWLALGEVVADCDHVAMAPLAPSVAEEIHQIYLAKGALATTAIEGNTLSEEEALAAVAGTLNLPPSRAYLKQEIDNVVAAYNGIVDQLLTEGAVPMTVATLERMNAQVLAGLEVEDHVAPGQVRTVNVSVGRYRCPEGRDARFLLERLCDVLNDLAASGIDATAFAILKAIFAHVYFVWIHPFGDGNGRTGRLLELSILLEAGLPQPVCHLLSNHYNQTRTDYYRQLERASRSPEGIYGFVAYALAGLVDGLREQMERIRFHQWDVAWEHFVHEQFRDARGTTDRRRRTLALALSSRTHLPDLDQLTNLNADVARAYAGVSRRTLMRDLAALMELDLLHRTAGGLRVHRERILAFLPWRHAANDD